MTVARLARTVLATLVLLLLPAAARAQGGRVTTGVYVSRYFEIRDHDQPVKYVFSGNTRVAAITGSLSSRTRVQRVRLYPGWNLVSLAITATNTPGQLGSASGSPTADLYQWDPTTGGYSQPTAGQTLSAGTVLWVNARTNAVVSLLGGYTDPITRHIQAAGSYAPGAGLEAWRPALPTTLSAWTYDAESKQWLRRLAGDLASQSDSPPLLAPGQAMYLHATSPVDLQAPDSSLRIRYYHQDHLGSSSVITDTKGKVVEETAYYPFGDVRNEYRPRQIDEPYKFTQKERDSESRLNYFEARYLAGPLSRFTVPDPKYARPESLSPDEMPLYLAQPQRINLYSYVRNNPLSYVDPTGLDGQKRQKPPPPSSPPDPSATLTLNGIGKLEISSLSTSVTRTPSGASERPRAGGSPGHPRLEGFTITRNMDSASARLMGRAAAGKPIKEAVITLHGPGKAEYLEYKLTDVFITSYSVNGAPGRDATESFTLSPGKVEFSHVPDQTSSSAKEPPPHLSVEVIKSIASLFSD